MADTFTNIELGKRPDLVFAAARVTLDGTTATWYTGLQKVLYCGWVSVSGSGAGLTVVDTDPKNVALSTFTTADVVDVWAFGTL